MGRRPCGRSPAADTRDQRALKILEGSVDTSLVIELRALVGLNSRGRHLRRRLVKQSVRVVVAALAATILHVVTATGAEATEATTEAVAEAPAAPQTADAIPDGVTDSIRRLYLSTLDRPADDDGLAYWTDRYLNGLSLSRITEAFLASEEWQRRMGELDDEAFVAHLYHSVLDRSPDAGGRDYWLAQAASGLSRTDMVLWFSEGEEFIARTGTTAPEAPPFPALPDNSGQGRRIVYSDQAQRVWIVDVVADDGDGEGAESREQLVDSYLVSGRDGVPDPGLYHVYSKSARAWAGHDGITMNHMVRFAWGRTLSIGFHSIPRYGSGIPMQTEAELGTYRSAGCVRQADHHAEALYHWARVGDAVYVVD
jgi:hypothetical protein